ncbi:MAG: PASTA domain-containing protein [Clostridia bacterium]|nr:PASTA domain-containing protein [Clostridia bacterium]
MAKRKKFGVKNRILICTLIAALLMSALGVRIAWLQTVDSEWLAKEATLQQTRDKTITSRRGTIYDRNGKELAVSASVELVSVSPAQIKKEDGAEIVAQKLAEILDLEYEDVYAKVTKNSSYETIKRKVEKAQTDQIRALKSAEETEDYFSGVYLEEDTKRYYPFGNFASHVLGFTGTDNQGLYGVEAALDDELSGVAGRIISVKNAAGTDMPFKYEQKYDSQDGMNVTLTIDETIQHFAEKYLQQAVEENKPAQGAFAIVMAPKTGEVYAMTTKPDYDLNEPFLILSEENEKAIEAETDAVKKNDLRSSILAQQWRNKAVSDTYEPGSVFKILTAAMALEEGVATIHDTFDCPGYTMVGSTRINCWKTQGHGHENFKEGLQNSCNPVFLVLGKRLGREAFFKYFTNFGLTRPTGIELGSEGESVYYTANYLNETELATSAFGQSFQVTPMQLITAISAIVNGGNLMRPYVVKSYSDSEGTVVKSFEPELIRQVVSEETSAIMRDFTEGVVAHGTGKSAQIKGYAIGGKTGTSEKRPRNENKYVASFIGMAPANDPELICLVAIDEPTGELYQGSQIAAPVVRNILEDTLAYMGIEKHFDGTEDISQQSVPEVRNMKVMEAAEAVTALGFGYKVIGEGEVVDEQLPKPGATLAKGSTVLLYTTGSVIEQVTVPDFTGQTMDSVRTQLQELGLNLEILGSTDAGCLVQKQEPAGGTSVNPATTVRVEFIYMAGD